MKALLYDYQDKRKNNHSVDAYSFLDMGDVLL